MDSPILPCRPSPPVLAAIWRYMGEGRRQWSSKSTSLAPQKYTRDGGWPTHRLKLQFLLIWRQKRECCPPKEKQSNHKKLHLNLPCISSIDTQGNAQRPPGSVQMYCPRRKLRWNILPGKDLICTPLYNCKWALKLKLHYDTRSLESSPTYPNSSISTKGKSIPGSGRLLRLSWVQFDFERTDLSNKNLEDFCLEEKLFVQQLSFNCKHQN